MLIDICSQFVDRPRHRGVEVVARYFRPGMTVTFPKLSRITREPSK